MTSLGSLQAYVKEIKMMLDKEEDILEFPSPSMYQTKVY